MYSRKSVIRTAVAALVIGAGLAAFGGTALADPSYRSQNAWQEQAWQHQSFWQHSRYHYGHYDHGRFGRVRYHQRWDHQGWHHYDWSSRHDGNVAYRAPAVRAYNAPSGVSFTINLPLDAGLNGH